MEGPQRGDKVKVKVVAGPEPASGNSLPMPLPSAQDQRGQDFSVTFLRLEELVLTLPSSAELKSLPLVGLIWVIWGSVSADGNGVGFTPT